eukprot:Phypoly_transcript_04687.p1 GENE.Phypoly_transcript_04687~~Phypoly_transcript_04687.p1  ORF type:complete len:558 (+),score=113.10 Phypoly_transcript_04687:270-1943(+)
MATLTSFLPAPTQPTYSLQDEYALFKSAPVQQQLQKPKKQVPPYRHRQGFVPRTVEDFGDGGAFPEIHVAQYPLDMGRKKNDQQVVPLAMDASGRVKTDAILGHGDKKIFSQYTDLIERPHDAAELARPGEEEINDATARTRAALEKIVNSKIQAAQPSAPVTKNEAPTYIKYTPAQQGSSFNSGASNRIIRMVEMPKDPLEPPKFKHKRVPRGPPSPPVPVMHSPPRKVTVKDQQLWKIPPCISNWKNSKGYTIPLDKRLAADGRGLQETQINDKFAKLSNSLYVAERTARKEVADRAQIQKNVQQREKSKREEMLRKLAEEARSGRGAGGAAASHDAEDPDQLDEKRERDRIREERGRERTRELRMEAAGKKGKILRDEDRDISEKVALGQGAGGPQSEESMFDQRLFNQTQGLEGGFGADDDYNVYSKPLFGGSSANVMYRPKKGAEESAAEDMDKILKTNKFRPDKEFEGVDRSKPQEPRNKPVEFEKEPAEDPFGLDEFLNTAKKSTAKRPLDKIGNKGSLHAGSTGAKDYQEQSKDSKRKKIDFEGSKSRR